MRKAILLAMAAAIVAMFAIPGSASAAWTKDHVNASKNFELEITGTDIFFESEIGGITCSSTISRVNFEVGTTGTVQSFEPESSGNPTTTVTQNCQGRGLIGQCDVHEATADPAPGGTLTELKWPIHTVFSQTVAVTTGTITNTLTGFFCPHTLSLTPGLMHFTTAGTETDTVSTATLSVVAGWLPRTDGDLGNNILTTISGTVHVLGTITYGF